MAVDFCVSTCGGHVCNVTLERKEGASLHLADLKVAIEAGANVTVDTQRLYHDLTELASDDDLEKVAKECEALDHIAVLLVKRSPNVIKWLRELKEVGEVPLIFRAHRGNAYTSAYTWMQGAPPEARENSEVLLAAIRQDGDCLDLASPELKNDRSFILAAVAQVSVKGHALHFVPPVFQADREVVMVAVAQSPDSLQFASPEFRADREVVTIAVKKSSLALAHASEELREDRELLRLAMGFVGDADADATSSSGVAALPAPARNFLTTGQLASAETGDGVTNRKELKSSLQARKQNGRRRHRR